ncbi:MAG: Fic family protein [Hyphomicrobiales bacterium]|nr:Fic family protein [Hyphomicrobiales bacterium]MBV8824922.1 Fic family protein [Hyphomicrobiales bacterium]MBV9429597.1 Fic family protein [Bradyrhizobiaceae bacterium]
MRVEDWASFDFSYSLDLRSLVPHILALEQYKAAALSPVLPPHWLEVSQPPTGDESGAADPPVWGALRSAPSGISAAEQSADDQAAAGARPVPVRDSSKARAWIKHRFVPGSAPVALADILELHRMVAEEQGVGGPTAGAPRTTNVEVGRELVGGVHQGAPARRLPQLMVEYVSFIDREDLRSLPPVIHALIAHFFLDTIHPFVDGNGRTSRLLAAAILSRHGYNVHGTYGLIRCFYRHELRYHTMLHRIWQCCPFAVTSFVAFGIEGFVLELKSVDTFIKMKLNRLRAPELRTPGLRRRIRAGPRGL